MTVRGDGNGGDQQSPSRVVQTFPTRQPRLAPPRRSGHALDHCVPDRRYVPSSVHAWSDVGGSWRARRVRPVNRRCAPDRRSCAAGSHQRDGAGRRRPAGPASAGSAAATHPALPSQATVCSVARRAAGLARRAAPADQLKSQRCSLPCAVLYLAPARNSRPPRRVV